MFNWVLKVIAELLWFCFTTLYDWFKKLAPPNQQIRTKTNHLKPTNQNQNQSLLGHTRFPALGRAWRRLRVFALSPHWLVLLFTFIVIGLALVLVLRLLLENCSIKDSYNKWRLYKQYTVKGRFYKDNDVHLLTMKCPKINAGMKRMIEAGPAALMQSHRGSIHSPQMIRKISKNECQKSVNRHRGISPSNLSGVYDEPNNCIPTTAKI